MGSQSSIEWTDATWNPVRGCSRVSPGCLHCYAEKMATRFSDEGKPFHLFAARTPKPHWTGKVELVESALMLPLKWRKPKRIFVNSMSDLFHENLPDEAIDRVFAVMALCPQHTFQCLTKRPERMRAYLTGEHLARNGETTTARGECALAFGRPGRFFPSIKSLPLNQYESMTWPLPNVWLGVSVENQATADERIPLLLQTPAAKRFVSYEPALGPGVFGFGFGPNALDWVIVGGESGPGARPFDIGWARQTIEQCREAGVACFVKQFGAKAFEECECKFCGGEGCRQCFGGTGHMPLFLKDRKGGDWLEWPEDLRVREFPA